MKIKRVLITVISVILAVAMLAGCTVDNGNTEPTAAPTSSPSDSANDKEASEEYVAKIGDIVIYTSEFYYFLYSGLRAVYYRSEGVYDESLSDEENYERMKAYFYSTKDDGTTYLDEAIQETLNIAISFKIAETVGKEYAAKDEKYAVSDSYISEVLGYVDSEASYGASVYSCSRDEYFFYAYGMTVNEAKRYTVAQLYASVLESAWSDENNLTFSETAPKAPDSDATDAAKAEYEEKLAAYNEKLKEYYEKFREEYEKDQDTFDIKTLRYLFISTKDMSESEEAEKIALVDKILKYYADGQEFEALVKGYSESSNLATDGGLTDIDIYGGSDYVVPEDAILWAKEQHEIDYAISKFEDSNGIYLVTLAGYITFDGITGTIKDTSTYNENSVKENAAYSYLSSHYNDYLDELAKEARFELNSVDNEMMTKLAKEYLEYDASGFES